MDIGNSIQNNRKRLGLSQEELGQQLSVSRQTVSQWETGQTMPSIDNLLRLKEVFGISLDALCGSEVSEEESPRELPLQEYRFAPTHNDIKEMCKLSCRPVLHRYLILTAICIAGIIASAFVPASAAPGFWVLFLLICILGFTLRFVKDRKTLRKPLQSNDGYEHEYHFFEEYFLAFFYRNGVQVSRDRFQYEEIKKFYHTKNFVILHARNLLYPLPKDVFDNVSPLQHYQDMNPRKKTLGPNVILWRTVSLILFLASIASIACIALGLGLLNSYNHLEVRNFWVCFLFVPIPVASIIFGIISIRKGYPCKKNIVIGIIMAVVLCVYGCFTFIFANVYTNDPIGVDRAESYLLMDMPECDYVTTYFMGQEADSASPTFRWYTTDAYFDTDATRDIMDIIRQDDRFIVGIPSELRGLTSTGIYTGDSNYVLFYNVDTGQYNEYPHQSGIYRIIMVAFDGEAGCMHISEYNINYIAN